MTESGAGFPGDHQRLAWTTTASQQQCYQNYSSYYTNMDYLSPASHQLNVVVGREIATVYSVYKSTIQPVRFSQRFVRFASEGDVVPASERIGRSRFESADRNGMLSSYTNFEQPRCLKAKGNRFSCPGRRR